MIGYEERCSCFELWLRETPEFSDQNVSFYKWLTVASSGNWTGLLESFPLAEFEQC